MSALEKQVGGKHYESEYQPIQFMADFQLNYIQGNVLKYVTRYKKKNGREDLEKAIHYCELGKLFKFPKTSIWDGDKDGKVNRYILVNGMSKPIGMYFIWQLCMNHLDVCKKQIQELIEEEYNK